MYLTHTEALSRAGTHKNGKRGESLLSSHEWNDQLPMLEGKCGGSGVGESAGQGREVTLGGPDRSETRPLIL